MTTPPLALLTLNLNNPSAQRARRQLDWLTSRPEQVLVLTETGPGPGSRLVAEQLTAAGWQVAWQPPPAPGNRGVLIASRTTSRSGGCAGSIGFLPERASSILLPTSAGMLELVGVYVPNRDATPAKVRRKQRFCDAALAALATASANLILLGDLNVLEPDHRPRYPAFQTFEYDFYQQLGGKLGLVDAFRHRHPYQVAHSWIGRTGDGYRYDHAFVAGHLADRIGHCAYLDQPREARLSDHAALSVSLHLPPPPMR